MTTLEKRYENAIKKIGYAKMLELPKQIKEILQKTKDLEIKVKLLEEIAKTFSRNAPLWSVSCGMVAAALMMADRKKKGDNEYEKLHRKYEMGGCLYG